MTYLVVNIVLFIIIKIFIKEIDISNRKRLENSLISVIQIMYKVPANDPADKKKTQSDSDSDSGSDNERKASAPPNKPEKDYEPFVYSKSDEVIEVFNARIFSFDEIDLNSLTNCEELILRKNLLHHFTTFPDHLASRLRVLDLFDNKFKRIGDFFETHLIPDPSAQTTTPEEGEESSKNEENEEVKPTLPPMLKKNVGVAFPCLVKLDLSYNQIKKISGLDALGGTLKELYLIENKIKEISGLDALVNLELLELGGNRIRSVGHSLDKLCSLKQLWLGKNKISSLDDSLHHLPNLEILSLQANRLTKIEAHNFPEGLLPQLREAYFSENGIQEIENIPFHNIRLLDFSMNPIATINEAVINVENMPLMDEFWLTDGKIKDWKEVEKFKPFHATLRTIYLERNPIEEHIRYRDVVYQHLPFITQIDSWPIVNKGNLEADRSIQRRAN